MKDNLVRRVEKMVEASQKPHLHLSIHTELRHGRAPKYWVRFQGDQVGKLEVPYPTREEAEVGLLGLGAYYAGEGYHVELGSLN